MSAARHGARPSRQSEVVFDLPRSLPRERQAKEIRAAVDQMEVPPLRDAVTQLLNKLMVARDVEDPRGGAKLAMMAVRDFVHQTETDFLDLDRPLEELLHALLSLDNGAIEPIFAARKVVHGRPISLVQVCLRAQAAAAAELVRRAGFALPKACEFVAHRIGGRHCLPGRGDRSAIKGATVQAWRREARLADSPTHGFYTEWLANLGGEIDPQHDDPLLAAEYVLADLVNRRSPAKM